jgi:Rieske Fe-S protein
VAAAALPWGCASVAVARVAAESGVVRIRPGDHPALAAPGGSLRLQPDGFPGPVYLLAVEDGYAAVSPICTHLGCTVGIEGRYLVCPCHGSTYDREGRVLRGPAERALRSFPVEWEPDGTLAILLEGR